LHHCHSALGSHYRRMRVKLGSPQAITASAHKFAWITYHRITTGQTYDESIFARHETRYKKMPT
jgi:transposase